MRDFCHQVVVVFLACYYQPFFVIFVVPGFNFRIDDVKKVHCPLGDLSTNRAGSYIYAAYAVQKKIIFFVFFFATEINTAQ